MTNSDIASVLSSAVSAHRAGRLDAAAAGYRQVLARQKDHFDALNLLGLVEHAQGRWPEALACFDRALKAQPGQAGAHYNRANTLMEMGRLEEAAAGYRKAVTLQPVYPDAWLNLGAVLHRAGDLAGATAAFEELVRLSPADARGHYNLAKVYAETQRTQEAIRALQQALRLAPDSPEWWSLLGGWLTQATRHDEAIAAQRRACALRPGQAEMHFNLGCALYAAAAFDEAVRSFTQATQLRPDFAAAYNNLGEALRDTRDFNNAIKAFDAAQTGDDQKSAGAALVNKAITLLAMERLDEGWDAYRRRFDARATQRLHRAFDYPSWQGESLADKKILLWGEQGPGDQILYGSMLPDVMTAAAACMLECDARLVPVFRRSYPSLRVVAKADPPHPDIATFKPDVQSALVDMGGALRRSIDSFPPRRATLRADENLTQRLRQKYARLAAGRPIIGLSWNSLAQPHGRFKSIPLALWSPILNVEDALFVSLQYADTGKKDAVLFPRMIVDDEIDAAADMDAFFSQVAALDLVISVSNTTVHVAGSLGVETWTLVPHGPGALWYWFLERTDSPWYPSMRLFRQRKLGEWSGVLADVSQALTAWRSARSS